MSELLRVACLQMNSSNSVGDNLAFIERSLVEGLEQNQSLDLLLLPENFAQMPKNRYEQYVELDRAGEVQTRLSELAQKCNTCIIAGSLAVNDELLAANNEPPAINQDPSESNRRPFSRSLVYANTGERIAHYDKLHLFDIDVPTQDELSPTNRYRESDSYAHGVLNDRSQSTFVLPQTHAKIGLTICYDLRFGELYRALAEQGAKLITVPSAFTFETGKAHWHTLLRARAIENQVYILAAAQVGQHVSGRRTYGHSMIVDPWGTIVAEKTEGEGLLIADIDLTYIDKLNVNFPIKQHRRLV